MATRRPALRELAARAGILPAYQPSGGGAPRSTSDATCEALLAAQGLDAHDEDAARRSLARLAEEEASRRDATRRLAAQDAEAGSGARAFAAPDALGDRRVFGLWANLYSLRSEGNLGVGDLGDLRRLVELAGESGAAFVGISPLHALRNRGYAISPYAPVSRLYRNAVQLDVDAVPEADDRKVAALRQAGATRDEVAALRTGPRIDPARAARLKERLAEALHAAFRRLHAGGGSRRARAYADFRAAEGTLLDDFATWQAIEEKRPGATRSAALRDPRSEAVRRFRETHAEAVDRHRFVQFELDRQLGLAAGAARAAGMPLGLYPDLALGSDGGGFDPWAFPGLFVEGVSVGAPPDAYAAEGQDWGFPPLHPWRLADDDFAFLRRLLRASLRHAGALRIDHVLGFFRQWWIPRGRPAREGAYVRFPARAMLRVAAQESRRARALLIGEDLGTVPPQVAPTLARHGILSSRVLLFEREPSGRFKPASRWSPRALATANTHDLPTLPAWLRGHDLQLRRRLGLLRDDGALVRAMRQRETDREALRMRLARDAHLPPAPLPATAFATWARAVHGFLCATPAPLVGLSLDDLAGEVEPVNVPGVGPEAYPSWTRRMGVSLEALRTHPGFAEALSGAAARGAPGAGSAA